MRTPEPSLSSCTSTAAVDDHDRQSGSASRGSNPARVTPHHGGACKSTAAADMSLDRLTPDETEELPPSTAESTPIGTCGSFGILDEVDAMDSSRSSIPLHNVCSDVSNRLPDVLTTTASRTAVISTPQGSRLVVVSRPQPSSLVHHGEQLSTIKTGTSRGSSRFNGSRGGAARLRQPSSTGTNGTHHTTRSTAPRTSAAAATAFGTPPCSRFSTESTWQKRQQQKQLPVAAVPVLLRGGGSTTTTPPSYSSRKMQRPAMMTKADPTPHREERARSSASADQQLKVASTSSSRLREKVARTKLQFMMKATGKEVQEAKVHHDKGGTMMMMTSEDHDGGQRLGSQQEQTKVGSTEFHASDDDASMNYRDAKAEDMQMMAGVNAGGAAQHSDCSGTTPTCAISGEVNPDTPAAHQLFIMAEQATAADYHDEANEHSFQSQKESIFSTTCSSSSSCGCSSGSASCDHGTIGKMTIGSHHHEVPPVATSAMSQRATAGSMATAMLPPGQHEDEIRSHHGHAASSSSSFSSSSSHAAAASGRLKRKGEAAGLAEMVIPDLEEAEDDTRDHMQQTTTTRSNVIMAAAAAERTATNVENEPLPRVVARASGAALAAMTMSAGAIPPPAGVTSATVKTFGSLTRTRSRVARSLRQSCRRIGSALDHCCPADAPAVAAGAASATAGNLHVALQPAASASCAPRTTAITAAEVEGTTAVTGVRGCAVPPSTTGFMKHSNLSRTSTSMIGRSATGSGDHEGRGEAVLVSSCFGLLLEGAESTMTAAAVPATAGCMQTTMMREAAAPAGDLELMHAVPAKPEDKGQLADSESIMVGTAVAAAAAATAGLHELVNGTQVGVAGSSMSGSMAEDELMKETAAGCRTWITQLGIGRADAGDVEVGCYVTCRRRSCCDCRAGALVVGASEEEVVMGRGEPCSGCCEEHLMMTATASASTSCMMMMSHAAEEQSSGSSRFLMAGPMGAAGVGCRDGEASRAGGDAAGQQGLVTTAGTLLLVVGEAEKSDGGMHGASSHEREVVQRVMAGSSCWQSDDDGSAERATAASWEELERRDAAEEIEKLSAEMEALQQRLKAVMMDSRPQAGTSRERLGGAEAARFGHTMMMSSGRNKRAAVGDERGEMEVPLCSSSAVLLPQHHDSAPLASASCAYPLYPARQHVAQDWPTGSSTEDVSGAGSSGSGIIVHAHAVAAAADVVPAAGDGSGGAAEGSKSYEWQLDIIGRQKANADELKAVGASLERIHAAISHCLVHTAGFQAQQVVSSVPLLYSPHLVPPMPPKRAGSGGRGLRSRSGSGGGKSRGRSSSSSSSREEMGERSRGEVSGAKRGGGERGEGSAVSKEGETCEWEADVKKGGGEEERLLRVDGVSQVRVPFREHLLGRAAGESERKQVEGVNSQGQQPELGAMGVNEIDGSAPSVTCKLVAPGMATHQGGKAEDRSMPQEGGFVPFAKSSSGGDQDWSLTKRRSSSSSHGTQQGSSRSSISSSCRKIGSGPVKDYAPPILEPQLVLSNPAMSVMSNPLFEHVAEEGAAEASTALASLSDLASDSHSPLLCSLSCTHSATAATGVVQSTLPKLFTSRSLPILPTHGCNFAVNVALDDDDDGDISMMAQHSAHPLISNSSLVPSPPTPDFLRRLRHIRVLPPKGRQRCHLKLQRAMAAAAAATPRASDSSIKRMARRQAAESGEGVSGGESVQRTPFQTEQGGEQQEGASSQVMSGRQEIEEVIEGERVVTSNGLIVEHAADMPAGHLFQLQARGSRGIVIIEEANQPMQRKLLSLRLPLIGLFIDISCPPLHPSLLLPPVLRHCTALASLALTGTCHAGALMLPVVSEERGGSGSSGSGIRSINAGGGSDDGSPGSRSDSNNLQTEIIPFQSSAPAPARCQLSLPRASTSTADDIWQLLRLSLQQQTSPAHHRACYSLLLSLQAWRRRRWLPAAWHLSRHLWHVVWM